MSLARSRRAGDGLNLGYTPVPSDWELVKAKWLFREINSKGHSSEGLLSVTQHRGVVPRDLLESRVWNPGEDVSHYKLVTPGDFVISLRSFEGGIEYSSTRGIVSPAYVVLRPERLLERWHIRYLRYLLKSRPFTEVLNAISSGIRQGKTISFNQFGEVSIPLPPQNSSRRIANCLNSQTSVLDEVLSITERLIELLDEKRTALTAQAVTKGLDPDVPMKDSGVKWLGEIPEHWDVSGFAWVVDVKEGPGILARDFEESGVPLLRIGNLTKEGVRLDGCNFLDPEMVKRKWTHFRVETGDLLISGSATSGEVSEVGPEAEGAIPYTGIMRLRPDDTQLDRGFLNYFLRSPAFLEQVEMLRTGVAIQHYGPTHLKQVSIPVPPLQEQRTISALLAVKEEPLVKTVAKTRSAIEKLHEYRSALITAAVTGKIDVRDHAA